MDIILYRVSTLVCSVGDPNVHSVTGQNGIGQNGIGQNGTGKMARTK